MEELENYAQLIKLGNPDFIEIKGLSIVTTFTYLRLNSVPFSILNALKKGVTYCGTSKASTLTMENVPWHHEVVTFGQKLCAYLDCYSLASEHEHSNCILLANHKFFVDGYWHTWINYEKYDQLIRNYYNTNGKLPIKSFLQITFLTN